MITVQYIIIALIFIAAVVYMIRKFMPSKGNGSSGCQKGCGSCSDIQNKVN
ncbi:FeoB-associated Cys-rich membrane protein [Sphingobacterium sp. SGG-5]|uniref:FeoB-associated Cys-rich membrane protein n=1 Tax=Sphingobacterium sp. SGG-5 TaxID=2710881 RepID=UPI0013EB3B4E|nr:FeoB-associated Cys-rich membrane protein [Sphingobacterium sp. SGG-5]